MYKSFVHEYGIVSIEDPYEQDDWDNWKAITSEIGDVCQVGGCCKGRLMTIGDKQPHIHVSTFVDCSWVILDCVQCQQERNRNNCLFLFAVHV